MFGRWITGLIVVGLAIGVWALWPRDDTNATSTTSPHSEPTTTTARPTTTSSEITTTSGAVASSGVIETVEEAEEVLRDFWFGWFEGIYNQDEDRIKEVVASQSQLEAAIAQFGAMDFLSEPSRTEITLIDTEILRADERCLAIWSTASFDFRGPGTTSGVEVHRMTDAGWKFVNSWPNRDDLWEQDCDAQLEPLS
ncbi:MAG: hypothetical protein WDZ96_05295 [Acidimicrobiia bacterium]